MADHKEGSWYFLTRGIPEGGLEKWPVTIGFASGNKSFFQNPLNPES